MLVAFLVKTFFQPFHQFVFINFYINDKNEKIIATIDGQVSSVYDKAYVDDLKNQVETKQKEVEKIIEELEGYNDDIKHYEFLADCFSNKAGGFKKYFIGEMIDVFTILF